MSLIEFADVTARDCSLGGKARGLARLSQKGFPVPAGIVIANSLDNDDWVAIQDWWRKEGYPPLAVRSSGGAEDSEDLSFAGQNQTFLNVKSESDLRIAIQKCFASVERDASKAYRERFLNSKLVPASVAMNVVLQRMVNPLYSGVFFSRDPVTGREEWVLEVVDGYGEKLVSGKVTPGKVTQTGRSENLPFGFTTEDAQKVAEMGLRVAEIEGYALDMEWSMDQDRRLQVLQSRPITALQSNKIALITEELRRLESKYPADTLWDGQTFSEWSGFPSHFTFSIWKNAFAANGAFKKALNKFGYHSFEAEKFTKESTLLERVFGRAYINLDRLGELYFGPIPYRLEPKPRPHTKFDWRKISPKVIFNTPMAIARMVHVAWNLSAKRSAWLAECREELTKFRSLNPSYPSDDMNLRLSLSSIDNANLKILIEKRAHEFSDFHLYWPLVLVILTESTVQRLQMILESVLGKAHGSKLLRDWMGRGLHTVTAEMRAQYQLAAVRPQLQPAFLEKYGHRGPGEMDLANPRWYEIGSSAFRKDLTSLTSKGPSVTKRTDVEDEIADLESFKREVVLEEWRFLKQMLELREEWKTEILKPYAQIRSLLVELGARWNLREDIHWLRLSEIERFSPSFAPQERNATQVSIERRKKRFEAFKHYHFPSVTSLREIKEVINGKLSNQTKRSFDGEPLSSGVVQGHVRVVSGISHLDTADWPEDTVLVTETTDPGWTPVLLKCKGIIIQNGGVLSHCAIVAREMGIPAVSGVNGCHEIFKDDDVVWVDGNNGKVYYESMV